MSDAAVRAEQLTRRFGALTALDALDFNVEPGESVAILGPNGAGKTTFLRLCGTLLRPTSGRVSLFGIDLGGGTPSVRRRLGMLSHQSFLYPDLTPLENLHFYARMFGVADAGRRVDELVERVGLGGWAQRPVRTLSRGLEQRCALARTLLHRPDVLLLDEPFSGLDLDALATVDELLRDERRRGATILLTTHDVPRALATCERGVVFVRGRMRWDGPTEGIDGQRFAALYASAVHGTGAAS